VAQGPGAGADLHAYAVTKLLERQLPDLVDYDFTARMEDELDAIARGDREATPWLHDFYYGTEKGGGSRTMSEGCTGW